MKYVYRKNGLRIKLFIPINKSSDKFIPFSIFFEKCRKKRMKGLYRLKFNMEQDVLSKEDI